MVKAYLRKCWQGRSVRSVGDMKLKDTSPMYTQYMFEGSGLGFPDKSFGT